MRKVITIALFAFMAGQAAAEAQFGVEVYPGAKHDAEVEKQVRDMKLNAKTYRTSDSVAKVTDFYKGQKLEQQPGANKAGSMFMGKGVMVTIQNPWADMKTGKVTNDTLISIVKQ
jgi:hypothetical protein